MIIPATFRIVVAAMTMAASTVMAGEITPDAPVAGSKYVGEIGDMKPSPAVLLHDDGVRRVQYETVAPHMDTSSPQVSESYRIEPSVTEQGPVADSATPPNLAPETMRVRVSPPLQDVPDLTTDTHPSQPPVAFVVTNPSQPAMVEERRRLEETVRQATLRRDYRGAAIQVRSWWASHPDDLDFARSLPALLRVANDEAGWERSRADLVSAYKAAQGRGIRPTNPSFLIEVFKVGSTAVFASQCYIKAGPMGVSYRMDVVRGGDGGRIAEAFVLESPEADMKLASQLGLPLQVGNLVRLGPSGRSMVATVGPGASYRDFRRKVTEALSRSNAPPSPMDLAPALPQAGGMPADGCELPG